MQNCVKGGGAQDGVERVDMQNCVKGEGDKMGVSE